MSAKQVLKKLIAFRTICETPNAPLIEFLDAELKKLKFRTTKLEGEFPGRQSLLASIGPETPNGIVFSAHSDVVPVEGQPWTSDPFDMVEKDGKLVGRGTSDMKGFIACILVAARHASKISESLKDPLHIAISYDEEIGCVGVRSLLKHLESTNFQAQGCIIGEPTEMKMVTGHKGKQAVKVTCTGLSGHSSNPEKGCNAILLAAELMKEVEALQEKMVSAKELHDDTYEVPYTTAQIGLINGGIALNIIPDHCEFKFEMRLLPSADAEAAIKTLNDTAQKLLSTKKFEKGSIKIEKLNGYPGVVTSDEDPFVRRLESCHDFEKTSARINFGTEGGLFQKTLNNVPVVVCGPGSIDRAHKADEWITEDELEDGVKFLEKAIDTLTK